VDRNFETRKLLRRAVALGLAMAWGTAGAVDVYLCAGATAVTLPDGVTVPMWGYAQDDNDNLADGCGNALQVPGPILDVPVGDPNLTVHLRNDLPAATSLVIPGQAAAMTPTFFVDGEGRSRVQSMTHETAAGATGAYTWGDVQPGSYIYHSGTHMAVQVQMGLYGALRKDQAAGTAYTGVPYDQEVSLFYSEIDPALHAAVDDGSYGSTGPSSTIDYQPKYFLVNGAAYDGTGAPLPTAAPGQRTLLRMHNMGLRTIIPTLLGQHLSLVAEDGSAYPYARQQYSVMLAAGKTRDAIFTPAAAGDYAIFDRSLNLTNAATGAGGQYSFLQTAGGAGAVAAVNDTYSMAEDGTLVIGAPGVLGNDTGAGLSATLFETTTQGMLTLGGNGSFSYTPTGNFNGTAQFSYRATDGTDTSAPATVSITVTPVNDPPVTVADSYTTTAGTALSVAAPGVLANDSDIDSTLIRVRNTQVIPPTNGTLQMFSTGYFIYTPNPGFTGVDSFTYTARDDLNAVSNASVVSITVDPAPGNQAPVAVDDYKWMKHNWAGIVYVLANDTDDGTLDPSTVTLVTPPAKGGNTATVNANGTITFTAGAGFRGSDTFEYTVSDNDGVVSNIATVRMDVVR
jgi:FtsP/CotA-like multicopper oxidase with cupredoxin domain